MRDAIFGFCLLAFASPAFAQAIEPRPFAMFGQLEVLKSESRGTLVGLDATVGVPVSEHVHLFGHFGRSHALMPDNLYSRLSVALQEASEIAGQEVTGAFWMPAWYGT